MSGQRQPTCRIIAGPNGAGKTTFALEYLPNVASCRLFVNADLIAAGMSPLAPEAERVAASRIFLLENLFGDYVAAVDRTLCFINSGECPEVLFTQEGGQREVRQSAILQQLPGWRPT